MTAPPAHRARGADAGNATVELLGLAVLLLVPLVYLVVTLARVQAATYAVEAAAVEAARATATAADADTGARRATAAVGLALADQGLDDVDPAAALTLACSAAPCLAPGSEVAATVTVDVDLPGLPAFVTRAIPAHVTVSAHHRAAVDEFRAGRS